MRAQGERLSNLIRSEGEGWQTSSSCLECPSCGAFNARGFGKNANGRKRFKCKSCGRSWSDPGFVTDRLVFGGMHNTPELQSLLGHMAKGVPLREAARLTGLSRGVAHRAFWRVSALLQRSGKGPMICKCGKLLAHLGSCKEKAA